MTMRWRGACDAKRSMAMFGAEEYIDLLVGIIRRLRPNIAIERLASQAPRHLIEHSPLGGMRPDELRNKVVGRMLSKGMRQGDLCSFEG